MPPTIDELTPAERHEIQVWYVRAFQARRRRRLRGLVRSGPATKRYDMAGNLVAVDGIPCNAHVSTWAEDRAAGAAPPRA
jgi:hypothetical protein